MLTLQIVLQAKSLQIHLLPNWQDSFLPSYNKGTDGLLVLRSSDDQPDEPFVVEEDHNYITSRSQEDEKKHDRDGGVCAAHDLFRRAEVMQAEQI